MSETLKYVHLKSEDYPEHDVTSVGYRLKDGKIEIQIARCHWPDRWCRRIAHKIVEGRMKKHGPLMSYDTNILETMTIDEILSSDWHPSHGAELPLNHFNMENGVNG